MKMIFCYKNYFFSGQTLDSDAPKKYMRENGNILVWCDLMPRVNLMYCITIKNGVVIYSWGSSMYIFLWLLWGKQVHFQTEKKWQKENEKLPIFCCMQSYFPPSFCSCCLCGCFTFNCCSTQLLISPRKALFRRKKTCLIAAFKARETLREFLKPKSSVLCFQRLFFLKTKFHIVMVDVFEIVHIFFIECS